MEAVIWCLAIVPPVAVLIFFLGWLAGFNESSNISGWGVGYDDGWKAHKEFTEEIKGYNDNATD